MSRDIDPDVVAQLEAPQLRPIMLIKAEFDSGDLRFWTGVGEIMFNDEVYTGSGNLLSVSEIKEGVNIEAYGATFSLSGIPSSLLALALNEDYQNRPITLWFGVLDDNLQMISNPFILFKGKMDVMQIDESGETASISIQAENRLIDLRRAKVRRYTPEDQKTEYPNDRGLDFVASLQELEVVWGRT